MGGALILLTVRLGAAVGRPAQQVRVDGAAGDGGLRRDRLVRRLDQDRQARPERPEVALEVPAAVDLRPGRRPVPVVLYADVPAATTFYVPLFKSIALPLAGVGFVAIAYFWIVGFSNAVNLTDGLDGLAIMPTVLVACALACSPTPPATPSSPATCRSRRCRAPAS
jgi:hypothetical protein